MRSGILKNGLLLFAMATGIFLRFYHLDAQSLWWDEGYSWGLVKDLQEHGLVAFSNTYQGHSFALSSDKMQPLFYILVAFLPDSWSPEWEMRFWSALSSSLSLIVLVAILKEQKRGYLFNLLVFGFASISPFLIWYAQEGRPYSLLLLFILIFIWLALKFPNPVSIWQKLAFILSILLIGATQFTGLIIPILVVLILLIYHKQHFGSNWAKILIISAVLLFPVFYLVVAHQDAPLATQPFSHWTIAYGFYTFLVGYSLGPSTYELHLDRSLPLILNYWYIIVSVAISGFIIFLGGLKLNPQNKKNIYQMTATIFIVFLIGVIIPRPLSSNNSVLAFALYPRRLIAFFPFFLYIMGVGLISKRNKITAAAGICLYSLMIWSDYNYFHAEKYFKDDLRGATEAVMKNERPGDIIMVGPKDAFMPYYEGKNQVDWLTYNDQVFVAQYKKYAKDHRIWVILSRPWDFDTAGSKSEFLHGNAIKIKTGKVSVFLGCL